MAKFKLPKTLGGWAGFVLKIAGVVTIASPAIKGVTDHIGPTGDGFVGLIPGSVVYYYSGYDPNSNTMNWSQTAAGATTIAAGVILAKVGSMISRMVR